MTALSAGPRVNLAKQVPEVYRAMAAFDGAVGVTGLDPKLRELIKLRASQLNGCAYCLHMHAPDARQLGETQERLDTLAAWPESPFFDERERAALALCDAVTLIAGDGVPAEIYAAAEARFTPDELAGLIWATVAINAWNRVAVTTHMVPGR